MYIYIYMYIYIFNTENNINQPNFSGSKLKICGTTDFGVQFLVLTIQLLGYQILIHTYIITYYL